MNADEEHKRRRRRRHAMFLPSQFGGALPMPPPANKPPVTEDPQPAKPGEEPGGTKTAEKLKRGEKNVLRGAAAVTGVSLAARLAHLAVKKKDLLPAAVASLALPAAGLAVAYRHRGDKTASFDVGVVDGLRGAC